MNKLRLVHSAAHAVAPPAELAPAEEAQAPDVQREPYVPGWMMSEGIMAFRARRAARRQRAMLRLAGLAAVAVAIWTVRQWL